MDWDAFASSGGDVSAAQSVINSGKLRTPSIQGDEEMFQVLLWLVKHRSGGDGQFISTTATAFIRNHPLRNLALEELRTEVRNVWRAYIARVPTEPGQSQDGVETESELSATQGGVTIELGRSETPGWTRCPHCHNAIKNSRYGNHTEKCQKQYEVVLCKKCLKFFGYYGLEAHTKFC
eukprot:EG_transcript_36394